MSAATPPPAPAPADLSNLFNSPSGPPPPRSPRSPRSASPTSPSAGPSRRQRDSSNPLFLSPGSATDSPRRPRASNIGIAPRGISRRDQPSRASPDLDLPDDIEFDLADLPDVAPPLRALNGNISNTSAGAGVGAGANGDFGYMLDPFAGLRDGAAGEDGDEGPAKKRRVVAKVDADRLTGEMGIIRLMKAAKRFKVKGKGRETEDLKELLNVYQMWAHGMFPKGDFAGTMARVEAVCRSRRMESAMKGYRDAFHPPPRSPTPPPRLVSPSRTPATEARSGDANGRADSPDAVDLFEQRGGDAGGGAQPLFSAGPDEADEPDWEELAAMEAEAEAGAGAGAGVTGHQVGPAAATARLDSAGAGAMEEEDEFEGLYD